jgi:glycosyltransferase involved in cell wall biosynthesis
MNNLKDTTLIFLTAGETPSNNSLIYSQVLNLAKDIEKQKLFKKVEYISCIPYLAKLASTLGVKKINLAFLKDFSFSTHIFYSGVRFGFYEFLFRKFLIKQTVNSIIRSNILQGKEKIFFHCRSYYATSIALQIKRALPHQEIKILFDMRSLFPPEFYFMMGKKGSLLYGEAKLWETELLLHSDLSVMTTQGGIELLKLENPTARIEPISIMGMNQKDNIDINEVFDTRWSKQYISYIGSISHWHPQQMIEKVLSFLVSKNFHCEIISNTKIESVIPTRTIKHAEIREYYDSLLATIIPGKEISNYYESLQLSVNLFSTKASEAISMGVPLIVNNDIKELSRFVIRHKCGIVFEIKGGEVKLINCNEESLQKKEFWLELTKNTFKVSKQFKFSSIMQEYVRYYKEL